MKGPRGSLRLNPQLVICSLAGRGRSLGNRSTDKGHVLNGMRFPGLARRSCRADYGRILESLGVPEDAHSRQYNEDPRCFLQNIVVLIDDNQQEATDECTSACTACQFQVSSRESVLRFARNVAHAGKGSDDSYVGSTSGVCYMPFRYPAGSLALT